MRSGASMRTTKRIGLAFAVPLLAALALAPMAAFGQGSSSSNATNFESGPELSINPRTGAVSLDATLFDVLGIREEVSARFILTYRSDEAISDFDAGSTVFGLPYGWTINLSHLANKNTYQEVNIDGSQTYVFDRNWRTQFTPAGQTQPTIALTGLKQYNRVDMNFRSDGGSVVVGGIPSAFVLASLAGRTQYLSASGLLLQDTDMFGNSIQYFYNGSFTPDRARVTKIVDSWGNAFTFDYGTPGRVTVTLPDGRTVGWVVGNQITQIIDAQGKVTSLTWANECGSYLMPTGITSASGGFTTIAYQCMNVCTQRTYPSSCANAVKQWPVVLARYDCATNPSGTKCPSGSSPNYLTTTYDIGGTQSSSRSNNYTGYPFYSPYAAEDPAADALMESNDTSFLYTTIVHRRDAGGIIRSQTESDYDFLHLEVESRTKVHDPASGEQVLARQSSNCYPLPGTDSPGCPMTGPIDYAQLPANYQQASRTGTCVYAVSGEQKPGARLSIVDQAYDSFGNMINRRVYHGTSATGVVSSCDRARRLDPSPLQVVLDVYGQYDTPTSVVNGFLDLGAGSGHYGLLTASQSFTYKDPDDADGSSALAAASAARR